MIGDSLRVLGSTQVFLTSWSLVTSMTSSMTSVPTEAGQALSIPGLGLSMWPLCQRVRVIVPNPAQQPKTKATPTPTLTPGRRPRMRYGKATKKRLNKVFKENSLS